MVNLSGDAKETREAADALIAENGYTFPVYYDTESSAALAYGINSIPQTVAVDAEGRIAAVRYGSLNEDVLAAILAKIA